MKRGMLVQVYRNDSYGDCTNGGASCYFNQFVLIGPGVPEISEPSKTTPPIWLYRNHPYTKPNSKEGAYYLVACPEPRLNYGHDELQEALIRTEGYMFGGNFIYTSDSRFPGVGPIPIHDRQEG